MLTLLKIRHVEMFNTTLSGNFVELPCEDIKFQWQWTCTYVNWTLWVWTKQSTN